MRMRAWSASAMIFSICVMPPTRGASGWMKSTLRWRISSQCSATLVSISPVAIGVSSIAAKRGMAFGVVGVQRLLDPREVQRLDQLAEALRGDAVPLLVGVDHQVHAAVDQLVHGLHALQVDHRVGLADLDLDAADAALEQALDVAQHLVDRDDDRKPPEVL